MPLWKATVNEQKIIWEGSKKFWREGVTVDITIISHTIDSASFIEVIIYDPSLDKEAPRLYIRSGALDAELDTEAIAEKLRANKEALLRKHKTFDNKVLENESLNQVRTSFITSRMYIVKYSSNDGVVECDIRKGYWDTLRTCDSEQVDAQGSNGDEEFFSKTVPAKVNQFIIKHTPLLRVLTSGQSRVEAGDTQPAAAEAAHDLAAVRERAKKRWRLISDKFGSKPIEDNTPPASTSSIPSNNCNASNGVNPITEKIPSKERIETSTMTNPAAIGSLTGSSKTSVSADTAAAAGVVIAAANSKDSHENSTATVTGSSILNSSPSNIPITTSDNIDQPEPSSSGDGEGGGEIDENSSSSESDGNSRSSSVANESTTPRITTVEHVYLSNQHPRPQSQHSRHHKHQHQPNAIDCGDGTMGPPRPSRLHVGTAATDIRRKERLEEFSVKPKPQSPTNSGASKRLDECSVKPKPQSPTNSGASKRRKTNQGNSSVRRKPSSNDKEKARSTAAGVQDCPVSSSAPKHIKKTGCSNTATASKQAGSLETAESAETVKSGNDDDAEAAAGGGSCQLAPTEDAHDGAPTIAGADIADSPHDATAGPSTRKTRRSVTQSFIAGVAQLTGRRSSLTRGTRPSFSVHTLRRSVLAAVDSMATAFSGAVRGSTLQRNSVLAERNTTAEAIMEIEHSYSAGVTANNKVHATLACSRSIDEIGACA